MTPEQICEHVANEDQGGVPGTWRGLRRVAVAVAMTGLVIPLGAPLGEASAVAATISAAQSADAVGKPITITLITGDRVQLVTRGGRQDVAIEPGRGGVRSPMRIRRSAGHVSVVPLRAQALLDAGKLDPRLFDVTQLVADGFTDQQVEGLPLIVTAATGPLSSTTAPGGSQLSGPRSQAQALKQARSTAQPPPAPAGSTVQRQIPRLGATAVKVPAGQTSRFWQSLTAPGIRARASATTPELAGGVGAVWLDGRIHASLDKSVPQIGGPAARAKGLDGKGVRVAVLDTGIDDQNPDLAGRVTAEQDFVGEGDVDDHNGHGTHVASTVAGSGARSGGKYVGVAPEASLLDGKVLDGGGGGSDSSVLAGMEWAASRAAVVSMSLGGEPTDGTDPLALAVDALSAQHNTLFVIAAGNSGDGGDNSTVGSPGSATSALTVGAVDRKDVLADFSSRGPRQGGSLIKPEITAPGVGIVAAQADGTEAGDVAAPGYVALSGTSMATPHVAGAAALLKQQHPAWTAALLKAALVSSAKPSPATSVWAQGAGRVDLANATANALRVDSGTLDFGVLAFPHTNDTPITRQVTYTNDGRAPLDVTITGALTNDGGKQAPATAVIATDPRFTLAAGASKTVTMTITPNTLDIGRWSGLVSATTSAGVTRTAIGVIKERERYTVTPVITDRHGKKVETGEASVDLINMVTGAFIQGAGEGVRVPPGTYAVSAWINDLTLLQSNLVNRLNVRVTKNTRVTLDARGSVPYRSIVPRADAVVAMESLGYEVRPSKSSEPVLTGVTIADEHEDATPRDDFWVHPLATRPSIGRFDLTVSTDHRPQELAARLIGGSPLKLHPVTVAPADANTEIEGQHTVEVVTDTTAVAGRFVLATVPADSTADQVAAGLAEAGATGVILRAGSDDNPYFDQAPPIPALGLPEAQWSALGQRAGAGSARIEITGTQFPSSTYNVLETFSGRVPRSLSFTYRDRDLARIDRTFRSHGTGGAGVTFLGPIAPASGFVKAARMKLGTHRTDWVSPGVRWLTQARSSFDPNIQDFRAVWEGAPRTYPRGRRTVETFGAQLARPGAPRANAYGMFPSRKADTLNGYLSSWTDPDGRVSHHGPGDTVTWNLSTGGQVVATGSDPGVNAKLRPGRTHYLLDLKAQRKAGEGWALSTASTTRWTFNSANVTGKKPVPVALLSLDTSLPLDIANTAPRGTRMSFTVTGRLPEGLTKVRLTALTVETSTDAGKTWTRANVKRRTDDTFTVQVKHPNHTGPVSLRMNATARGQVSLQQEVTAAYALR